MQPTPSDIEQIIRVVMQRLAVAGDLMSGIGAIADNEDLDGELVLRDRVITLSTLEGKLSGKKKVRVHPRAVVTPAVTDELRRFKVELVRDNAASSAKANAQTSANTTRTQASPVGSASPVAVSTAPILVCGSALWFSSLSRHLCSQQATVQPCDDQAAIGLLKQHKARGGSRAIWLTSTPFAASVSLAQAACCTSVILPSLGELSAALAQANPECLIIDASRTTVAAIGNIVRTLFKHSRAAARAS